MTRAQFVREICKYAAAQPRPPGTVVFAIDLEPSPEGIRLTFRFKEQSHDDDQEATR